MERHALPRARPHPQSQPAPDADEACDFYFVPDVDNFIRPCALRELVALDLPIVAPLLRSISPGAFYSNYHAEVDANGYYASATSITGF